MEGLQIRDKKAGKNGRRKLIFLFVSALIVTWTTNARLVRISRTIYGNYNHHMDVLKFVYVFNISEGAVLPLASPGDHGNNGLIQDQNASIPSTKTQVAIFYNAFISEDNPSNAHEIIKEQIDAIGKSYLTSAWMNTTIYYSTLGRPLPSAFMEDLCREHGNLTCQHLRHYKTGYEEVTLASLFQYCQQHPDERVVYIHSKGEKSSFEAFEMKLVASYRLIVTES